VHGPYRLIDHLSRKSTAGDGSGFKNTPLLQHVPTPIMLADATSGRQIASENTDFKRIRVRVPHCSVMDITETRK